MSATAAAGMHGRASGFSLVEIAVVLLIVIVLIGVVAVPLSNQVERQRIADTEKQLENVKEALYGFAMANGRLPCPATSASAGVEAPGTGGACTVNSGFVPAVTLGLTPVDSGGYNVDAWGLTQNRLRYAVADVSTIAGSPATCIASLTRVLTTANQMQAAGMSCLADTGVNMLTIRSTTVNSSANGCTPSDLSTKVPFVVFSLGKNAATGGTGADEAQNLLSTATTFIAHSPTNTSHCAGEFDDVLTWGSLNTLFARMVQAGKLP